MSRKKNFFWWKVTFTVLSCIIAIVSKSQIDWKSLSNNYIDLDLVKEIVYDCSIGMFSAMIIVWFIDEIGKHIQDKKDKSIEREKICRANRVLQLYIERYKLFYYCVTTPLEKRDFKNVVMKSDFMLRDMKDLYQTTKLMSEGFIDSSINCFVKAEIELKDEMEAMIRSTDFSFFPDIQNCLLEFVEISIYYNYKESWIKAKTTGGKDSTIADIVVNSLKTEADDWYREYRCGKRDLSSNVMLIYFGLYEMLIKEQEVLHRYEQMMDDLVSNKQMTR